MPGKKKAVPEGEAPKPGRVRQPTKTRFSRQMQDFLQSEGLIEDFLVYSQVGLIVLYEEEILFANLAAEEIVGKPLAEWNRSPQGKTAQERKNIQLWSEVKGWMKSGKTPQHIQAQFFRAGSEERFLELSCHLSKWNSSLVMLVTMVDITDLMIARSIAQRRAYELEVINSMAALANASLGLGAILDYAIESVLLAIKADHSVIYLLDDSRPDGIWPNCYRGLTKREAHFLMPKPTETSQTWKAIKEHRVIYIPDVNAIEGYSPLYKIGITSFVTIPLFSKEKAVGALNAGIRGKGALQMLSMEVLASIGDQIGMAIERAELLESRDREIRERRRVEAALIESEARYRQIINTSPEAVALIDVEGNFIVANMAFAQLFGYASSELLLESQIRARALFSPEFYQSLKNLFMQLQPGGKLGSVQGLMRRRDDSLFTAEVSVSAVFGTDGKPVAIVGIVRDVSERQKYDEALHKSEERYRTLAEAANDMIFIIDRNDRVAYANRFAAGCFDVDPQEIIGKRRSELFGNEGEPRQKSNLQKVFKTGKPLYSETRTDFPGRKLWLGTWLAPILDQTENVIQILGVSRDITEYKETAQRLADSEQRFRDSIERSVDGYYFIDKDGAFKDCNLAFTKILRFAPADLIALNFANNASLEVWKQLGSMFSRAKSGKNIRYAEINIALMDGERRWLCFNARRVIKDGIVIGVEGFIRDITEQKAIAEALQASEARYRSLFDSIRYEVYSMNREGRYRETNAAFQEAWGSVLGKRISEVIKDRKAARRYRELIKRVFETRVTVQESLSLKRDGSLIHYSATMSPVLTEDGQLIGLVGMNLDVSEQVIMYDSLRAISLRLVQVQEEERRRIAAEIHDSLGQQLTALQFEVTAAAHALSSSGTPPQSLVDAALTIEESITMAQNLCYDLRPPLLDDFGLEAALRDHLTEYQEKWGINIDFFADDLGSLLSRDAETALFRIAQEALNNVLKHATAKNVKVRLNVLEEKIALTIEDDGCGFDVRLRKKRSRSDHYGLMTMNERIELLGGELVVASTPGAGTTIIALLPVDRREEP